MNPTSTQPNTPMGGQPTQPTTQPTQQPNPFQSMMNTVRQNPNSDYASAVLDKIRSGEFNNLAKQYGYDLTPFNTKPPPPPPPPAPEQGLGQRLGADFMKRGADVVSAIQKPSEVIAAGGTPLKTAQAFGEAGFRTATNVAGAAVDIVGETAKSAWNTFVPDVIKNAVSGAVQQGGQAFLGATNILGETNQQTIQKIADFSAKHPEATKDFLGLVDVASLFGLKAIPGAQMTGQEAVAGAKGLAEKGMGIAIEKIPQVGEVIGKAGKAIKEGIAPTLSPIEAVGQIAQGKTIDVPAVQRTLQSLDTTNIKTYRDLATKIKDEIPKLADKVDAELSTDKIKRPISTFTKTVGDTKINYVDEAIKNLSELYKNTSDAKGIAYINKVQAQAKDGLTYLDINNISRKYGSEFGSKAFSKVTGDALTSVNAQKFENIRSGLKETARQGLHGEEAKALDAKLSDLYDTQKVIQKNVESVNKAAQKTPKQGIIPKAVGKIVKTADIVTGGPLKAMGKAMGMGDTTVLSPTEIESNLAKNLKTIRDGLKK